MAKLHGTVFLAVGIIMYIISFTLNKKNDNSSLLLFIYISYLFIAYGISKIVVSYILQKGKKEADLKSGKRPIKYGDEIEGNIDKLSDELNVGAKDGTNMQALYGYIGVCDACGTPMRKINIYCHRCGRKQSLVK